MQSDYSFDSQFETVHVFAFHTTINVMESFLFIIYVILLSSFLWIKIKVYKRLLFKDKSIIKADSNFGFEATTTKNKSNLLSILPNFATDCVVCADVRPYSVHIGSEHCIFWTSLVCLYEDSFVAGSGTLLLFTCSVDVLQRYRESEARNVDLLAVCRQHNRCVEVSHCRKSYACVYIYRMKDW